MKSLREYILESVQSDVITLKDITKLDFYEVSNYNELEKIIKDSGPDKDNNEGFWLFSEALEKDKDAYANINKEPWYINYIKCEATYTKDNKEHTNICGLISYSLKYWDNEDNINNKPIDGNIMHIFDIQTISTFKGLLSKYFEKIEEIAKSNKCKALTLKCYEPSLKKVYRKHGFKSYRKHGFKPYGFKPYKKHGFKPVKGQNNLMIKKINDKENNIM